MERQCETELETFVVIERFSLLIHYSLKLNYNIARQCATIIWDADRLDTNLLRS